MKLCTHVFPPILSLGAKISKEVEDDLAPNRLCVEEVANSLTLRSESCRLEAMTPAAASALKRSRQAPLLRVKKLSEHAVLPVRGSALAAGLDLAAAYDAVVPAGGKALVKTDLSVALPDGCYARVGKRRLSN